MAHNVHNGGYMRSRLSMLLALSAVLTPCIVTAQSQTTGTLNLRNAQPATVSLSIPTAGVTGYTLLLPPSIGVAGQSLTIGSVSGTSASLQWTDTEFWSLEGNSIVAGGTATGQQYLGSTNAQDLVLGSNGSERVRVVGVTGPSEGYVGIGTANPAATLDVRGNLLLSNGGVGSELRFAEPATDGTNFTAFKAGAQAGDVTYTLPPGAPSSNGMVLSASTTGVMSWSSPLERLLSGSFTPTPGQYQHVIAIPTDVLPGAQAFASVMNLPGTTIGFSVTNINDVANTITVETSVSLTVDDRILWMVINP